MKASIAPFLFALASVALIVAVLIGARGDFSRPAQQPAAIAQALPE